MKTTVHHLIIEFLKDCKVEILFKKKKKKKRKRKKNKEEKQRRKRSVLDGILYYMYFTKLNTVNRASSVQITVKSEREILSNINKIN